MAELVDFIPSLTERSRANIRRAIELGISVHAWRLIEGASQSSAHKETNPASVSPGVQPLFQENRMKTYTFRVLVDRGVIQVQIQASGYFAAENAVLGMYPGGRILSWK